MALTATAAPGVRGVLARTLDALLMVAAVAALVPCCRGVGSPFGWLMVPVTLAALRCVLDRTFRQRFTELSRMLWAEAAVFPRGAGRLPWRAALAFVTLPALLLLLSSNRTLGTGDTWPVLPAACAAVTEGDAELSRYVPDAPSTYCLPEFDYLPYCVQRTPRGLYSSYPPGMVQFAVPVAAVARCTGADLANAGVRDRLEKWTAACLAALTLGLFFLLALHLAPPGPAWTVTLFLAAGSALFSTTGQALWQHGGVLFWSVVALLAEFRHARAPSRWTVVVQGVACGWVMACRLSAVVFVLPFGLWLLVRAPRRAVLTGVAAACAFLPWAWWNLATYGNPCGPSAGQMAGECWTGDAAAVGVALAGLLVSPARGLLVYQPWILLALVPLLVRGPKEVGPVPGGWRLLALAVIAGQLVLVAGWRCWWGGHCWGSRLLTDALPLCALLCVLPAAWLWRSARGRAALGALALAAFLMQAVGVYVRPCWDVRVDLDRHPEMVWSWQRPPFLMLDRPRN